MAVPRRAAVIKRMRQPVNVSTLISPPVSPERNAIHGVGVGLRSLHFQDVLNTEHGIPWFEILTDNYLVDGGPLLYHLDAISQRTPIVMHGVGLSLGSTDPINSHYLNKVRDLIARVQPVYVSDHLCWVSVDGAYLHELLPLPYTDDVINHVSERIKQVQDSLGRQILIENVSSYLTYQQSTMPEWEFINKIAAKADCGILLDVNNIYVSAINHDFNPITYLQAIEPARVKQFHIAGFEDCGQYLLDNHGGAVASPVWTLYRQAVQQFGSIPTLLEWDNHMPSFSMLSAEAAKAQKIMDECV